MSEQIKLIIFDFDGTIANSLELGFEIYQECADKYHLHKLKDFSEYQELMHLSVPKLIWKLRIPPWKLEEIIHNDLQVDTQRLLKAPVFPGIPETITQLAQKYQLAIVTSNLSEPVKAFLSHHQLDQHFSAIIGSDTMSSKAKNIQHCLTQFEVTPEEAVLIGDSTRDIRDAKKNQLLTLAVSYGIHCQADLAKEQPDALVNHPTQIISALEELLERVAFAST